MNIIHCNKLKTFSAVVQFQWTTTISNIYMNLSTKMDSGESLQLVQIIAENLKIESDLAIPSKIVYKRKNILLLEFYITHGYEQCPYLRTRCRIIRKTVKITRVI